MRKTDRMALMGGGTFLVFIGLLLLERCTGTTTDAGLLLAISAVGTIVVAIPFLCIRLWGVSRRNTITVAIVLAGAIVMFGVLRGNLEMGHFATIPGWMIGVVFGAWILIVAPIAAVLVADKQ